MNSEGLVEQLAWIVLFLPLLAAVIITLFTQKDGRLSATLSIGAVVIAFLISVALFLVLSETKSAQTSVTWLSLSQVSAGKHTVEKLQIDLGLWLDPLSLLMLLIVTGVGGAIHIYSYGYMAGERGLARYFAGLSLFTFSMLGIVLANNF